VQVTRPYLYDVLIIGMSAGVFDEGSLNGLEFVSLQIADTATGIPWVAPNLIGYSPVLAFAGLNLNPNPITKLPEAFFLPAYTQLRLEWTSVFNGVLGADATVNLTLIGIQMMNHRAGFRRPTHVQMPNGSTVEVGSRMPWFGTIPFGEKFGTAFGAFSLDQGQQVIQYLPPSNCDVEIHDAYSNFKAPDAAIIGDQSMKFADTQSRNDWTPGLSPVTAVLGDESQAYTALPFTMPHVLKKGHRTMFTFQNNNTGLQILNGSVTLRGVRRCEY